MAEKILNFVDSSSVTWAITDDPGNNRYDLEAFAAPPATQWEQLSTAAPGVLVNNGGQTRMPWAHNLGSSLLDLTTPDTPLIRTAGIYCVSVSVEPFAGMTAGGQYQLDLQLRNPPITGSSATSAPAAGLAAINPKVSLSKTASMKANDGVVVIVWSFDGASARRFGIFDALVQRIS